MSPPGRPLLPRRYSFCSATRGANMSRLLSVTLCGVVALVTSGAAHTAGPRGPGEQADEAGVRRARQTVRMLDDIYKQAIILITDKYVNTKKDSPAGRAAIKWLND